MILRFARFKRLIFIFKNRILSKVFFKRQGIAKRPYFFEYFCEHFNERTVQQRADDSAYIDALKMPESEKRKGKSYCNKSTNNTWNQKRKGNINYKVYRGNSNAKPNQKHGYGYGEQWWK